MNDDSFKNNLIITAMGQWLVSSEGVVRSSCLLVASRYPLGLNNWNRVLRVTIELVREGPTLSTYSDPYITLLGVCYGVRVKGLPRFPKP